MGLSKEYMIDKLPIAEMTELLAEFKKKEDPIKAAKEHLMIFYTTKEIRNMYRAWKNAEEE